MDIWGAIRKLSHDTGMSFAGASRLMGKGNSYIVSAFGRGKCPSFDNANRTVRAFGYSLCIVKQGDEPSDAILVDETADGRRFTAKSRENAARKERERRRAALLAELERLGEQDDD